MWHSWLSSTYVVWSLCNSANETDHCGITKHHVGSVLSAAKLLLTLTGTKWRDTCSNNPPAFRLSSSWFSEQQQGSVAPVNGWC